ncbi:unnamed protein product [Acanthoscelides obtectus]|nr:unnamed protein product [Acanthoscelides obtectus]CAK1682203.1 hypothetical protein AOBTE_LOCUS33481 [Acanthoscelides obtectus]
MCDNIINNDCSSEVEISNSRSARTFKRLITPPIPIKLLNDLGTALGVYFSPVGMSWAKISKEDNYLLNWGFYSFCSLPKTMLSNDIFNLAVSALQKLPSADMYVLESMSNGRPTKMKLATIASDGQVELASMLIALLNTSMKHNTSLTSTDKAVASKEIIENRVFFLKSNVPARLFKILVGNEKVSAITKVTRLIENDGTFEVEVPCSPISVNSHLKQAFMAENSENKELLSQALMLVVTFMDVCVRKNPATLASISSPQSAAKG